MKPADWSDLGPLVWVYLIQISRIRFDMTTSNRLSLALLTVLGCGTETVVCLTAIMYPKGLIVRRPVKS